MFRTGGSKDGWDGGQQRGAGWVRNGHRAQAPALLHSGLSVDLDVLVFIVLVVKVVVVAAGQDVLPQRDLQLLLLVVVDSGQLVVGAAPAEALAGAGLQQAEEQAKGDQEEEADKDDGSRVQVGLDHRAGRCRHATLGVWVAVTAVVYVRVLLAAAAVGITRMEAGAILQLVAGRAGQTVEGPHVVARRAARVTLLTDFAKVFGQVVGRRALIDAGAVQQHLVARAGDALVGHTPAGLTVCVTLQALSILTQEVPETGGREGRVEEGGTG
jgi:hypothetical protein